MALTIETECECGAVIRQQFDERFEEAVGVYDFKTSDDGLPDEEDEFTICFAVECPVCERMLEWPQMWNVV